MILISTRLDALPTCHLTLAAARPSISVYERAVKRYPDQPKTIGDHLRRRRLDLGLEQADVAKTFNVHRTSVQNWESSRYEPGTPMLAKIVAFLGYNPGQPNKKKSPKDRKIIK
jgi:DNA-binding transcriptional regulator YiaG